jgi:hypothetical protein
VVKRSFPTVSDIDKLLRDKRFKATTMRIDSERGIYEVRFDFEDGHYIEIWPDGFGLNVSGGQEYVGPPRP